MAECLRWRLALLVAMGIVAYLYGDWLMRVLIHPLTIIFWR